MTEDERRALRAIEQNLVHTDPAFAARMIAPKAAAYTFPVLSVLCAVAYICVPVQALLFGWRGALVTLGLTAVIMTILLVRRRSQRPQ